MVKWLVIVLLLISVPAVAMSVRLQWDANTESDLAGYKCYYRTKATPFQRYTTVYGFANQTSACRCTITQLKDNERYSFAVTAFNNTAIESRYSNQVGSGSKVMVRKINYRRGGRFK